MPERFLGQTLGKFRVDAVIGSGGFAWVYKAYDPELEIPVALKVLKPQYGGDELFEQRFRREASTAAKLRHPNIIKIFAVGREGEAVYFAMDYLPQGLADRLSVMTALPESMLIRMGIDVGSALGFAHREGVIHRDIKADNILFDEHGNAIVADFGIARAVSGYVEQTGTNMVVGTPQYFSPEQARGLPLDGRSDLYSLGVTLFKAATGSLPFTGTDWYEIARQHVEDKPPRPRSINPALSRDVEDIILRCLEKEPDNRYPTGEALCEDLVQLLAERGESNAIRTSVVPAADTLGTRVSVPWLSRRRRALRSRGAWIAGGAAAILLAIVILANSGRDDGVARATVPGATEARGTARRTGAGDDTVGTAPRPVLTLRTPREARVTLNDVPVESGEYRTDTLPPGDYTVTAVVDSRPQCPAAHDRQQLALPESGSVEKRLSPRACGTIEIETPNGAGADYTIVSLAGDPTRTGRLPLRRPLVLAEGAYQLRVQKPRCAQYTQPFRIYAQRANSPLRFRLICPEEGLRSED